MTTAYSKKGSRLAEGSAGGHSPAAFTARSPEAGLPQGAAGAGEWASRGPARSAHADRGDGPADGPGAMGAARGRRGPSGLAWGLALALLISLLIVGGLMLLAGSLPALPAKGCVGVIDIRGEITAQDGEESLLSAGSDGSETMAQRIEDMGNRSDVKALLVVVDSPGGSVVASHDIYQALKGVGKPKVSYFREVAASGGYYVAMGTDYIVSEPDALTGSIGVRATFSDLSGLFEKVGYNETTIKSGELKDIGSPSRPMTDKERAIVQALVDEMFGEFKQVVLEGRGARLDRARFEEVLDARILSGRQAHAIGMVDELGNRKAALRKASEMAGEEGLPVCEVASKPRSILGKLLAGMAGPLLPETGGAGWRFSY